MILTDIKRYLMQRPYATLRDIALFVDAQPEAVRGMLQRWELKGMVVKQRATVACGSSCNKCDLEATQIYRWRDDEDLIAVHPGGSADDCEQAPAK